MPPCPISSPSSYRLAKTRVAGGMVTAGYSGVRRQQRLQHLLRDGRGDLAARRFAAEIPSVLDDHCDRVARCLGGCEGDEPSVRVLTLRGLRGTRLAGHSDAVDLRGGAAPALHD